MQRLKCAWVALMAISWLTSTSARAQSAPTCSFDPGAAAITVAVNGMQANLRVVGATGEIQLNGASCGGATVVNTDSIQVNGGSLGDTATLAGSFEPGLTPEADGDSEIEIAFALGNSPYQDTVVITLGRRDDRIEFTSDGIDVGHDLDRDILTGGTEHITVNAGDGDDRIDATAYASEAPSGSWIEIHGGNGRDRLLGSLALENVLYGEDGDDRLYGGNEGDEIHGGVGNDYLVGGGGYDHFREEATADGQDTFRGGDGVDTIHYSDRVNGVTVTLGDLEPDGETGEGDLVLGDVENVVGGHGPDVLVGTEANNSLNGLAGNDELYGRGGADVLVALSGTDILVGDDGDDHLDGGAGADSLDGGRGADDLFGGGGPDVLQGGSGMDHLDGGGGTDEFFGDEGSDTFVNSDGVAETVDCGAGVADDPQSDPLDTYVGCEL